MKVFSTLRSDQIDITRTSSEGVAGIKAFLEYSEKGKKVLTQKDYFQKQKTNSFEHHIAGELRKFGYDVQTNIGCSGYRIDVGVVNPENTSEYILGILTDGENYKSAKTAKDREMIRMQVLQLLGWNIYKLWSPDWWDNPRKILKEIKDAIRNAQNPVNPESISTEHPKPAATIAEEKREQFAGVKLQGITQQVIETHQEYPVYKACSLPATFLNFSDEFFDTRRTQKILTQIQQVIQKEAPISQSLLSKRILSAWGISRLGVRLKEYLDGLYDSLNLKYTRQNGSVFYWNSDQSPETYNTFRIPENEEHKRSAEDLPKEEIAAGMVEILTNQISLPPDDLVKETARLFGYARLGGNVEQAMKTGTEYALQKGMIAENNERIVLT
jgi:very-short-patch-repair endonuclease